MPRLVNIWCKYQRLVIYPRALFSFPAKARRHLPRIETGAGAREYHRHSRSRPACLPRGQASNNPAKSLLMMVSHGAVRDYPLNTTACQNASSTAAWL